MEVYNIFEVLGVTFFIQTCLYITFLLYRTPSKSDVILATLLGVLVLLFTNLFIKFHWIEGFPYYYYEFIAMIAPLQFLYTKSLVNKEFKLSLKDSIHFLGVLLLFISRLSIQSNFIEIIDSDFEKLFFLPLFIYLFVYLIFSFRTISNFYKTILLTRSNFNLYNLKWLKIELIMLSAFFITINVESLYLFIDFGDYYFVVVLFSFISILLFINILTFKSLLAPIQVVGISKEEDGVFNAKKMKYGRSKISSEKSKILFESLIELMENEKPYIEYRLSLSQLANLSKITSAELSQIINENSNMNFNDFINSYRVENAKSLIREQKDWLIKEVMYKSGFQSTSTFNSAFKKFTGKSPSEFYKQSKNQS